MTLQQATNKLANRIQHVGDLRIIDKNDLSGVIMLELVSGKDSAIVFLTLEVKESG